MEGINDFELEIEEYIRKLREDEKSPSTVRQYAREVRAFFVFMGTKGSKRVNEDAAAAAPRAANAANLAKPVHAAIAGCAASSASAEIAVASSTPAENAAAVAEGFTAKPAAEIAAANAVADIIKEDVIDYKEMLKDNFRPATVNAKIAAINSFFAFAERPDLKVKQVKIQKKPYSAMRMELTKAEYERLVETARRTGDERLALVIQTICATGIRVSELSYITADAVRKGEAVVDLKGKIRVVLIAGKLKKALVKYMKRAGIIAGAIFVTKSGKPLDRSNIWKMMKALCEKAGVSREKVFPHNLRKLFARCFYKTCRDIAKLADILGHSSINTTRIYIATTGAEHRKSLDALELVV